MGGGRLSITVSRVWGYGSTSRPRALAGGMGVWVGSAAACVRCNNVCGQTSKHIAQQQYSSRSPLNMFTTVQRLLTAGLEMVDAKKCGLCYEWFEAEQMRWDAEPYCYVCKDDEACTARRPGARGRKRARREGSYASMSRGA